MAISWGAYEGSNSEKVGIDISMSPSAVIAGVASVTLTVKYYVYSKYSVNDNQTLTYTGAITGSTAFTMDTVGSNVLVATKTLVVPTSYAGTVTKTFGAAISGHYGGATPSESDSYVVPKRPYSVPAAPTALTHARNSDTQNTVGWANTATTDAPYTTVEVERQDNGGAWLQVASIAGTSTSFVDTTTTADNVYAYRVRGSNAAGFSPYSGTTAATSNTPAAPATPTATKTGTSSVQLDMVNASNSATATEIERRTNGGAWANIATTSGKASTYTDSAVPAGTVDYRVRNKVGTLLSAYTADSNDVTTASAPAAPTSLTPTGGSLNGGAIVRLAWTHNSMDGSSQSAYELQYRTNGGAWVPTGKVVSGAQYRDIAAGTFAQGGFIEWQVKTYGVYATAGAFSSVASFTSERIPTANVTTPATNGAVVTTLPLTVSWSFGDRVGLVQASYELSVTNASGISIFSAAGNGTGTSVALPLSLANLGAYTIVVTVRSSSGLSGTATRTFSTAYLPPLAPVVTTDYIAATGRVNVALGAGENYQALGGKPATATMNLYRVEADGSLLTLATGIVGGGVVTDYFPPLNVPVTYRALAVSISNSVEATDTVTQATVGRKYMLNYGAGFPNLVVLFGNVSTSQKPKRDTSLYSFAGRTFPVLFEGENREEGMSLAADILDEETYAALRDLQRVGGRVLYRDPDGGSAYVRATLAFGRSVGKSIRTVSVEMDVLDGTTGR